MGLDVDLFATQLAGVHKMLALFLKEETFIIKDDEAKKLAQALKNVMALHSLNISPSAVAYIQLLGICAAIYGPRFMALKFKAELKRAQSKAGQAPSQPASNAPTVEMVFPTASTTQ